MRCFGRVVGIGGSGFTGARTVVSWQAAIM